MNRHFQKKKKPQQDNGQQQQNNQKNSGQTNNNQKSVNQANSQQGTQQQGTQKKHYKHYHKNGHKNHHQHQAPPKWDYEEQFRGQEFTETKSDLMEILASTDPEEITITPLVQKNKKFPDILGDKKKEEELKVEGFETEISEITEVEEEKETVSLDNVEIEEASQSKKPKTIIDISQTCPICERAIREIMYALHDYEHNQLAHFDCVFRKVKESAKDKLGEKNTLVYLGSGSFGIMEVNSKTKKMTLLEKIYPGAPVEELLHGGEIVEDDEI